MVPTDSAVVPALDPRRASSPPLSVIAAPVPRRLETLVPVLSSDNLPAWLMSQELTFGTMPNVSSWLINQAGKLSLDSTGTNVSNRLGTGAAITLSGGELALLGSSAGTTAESVGTITLNSGYNTITVNPGSSQTA